MNDHSLFLFAHLIMKTVILGRSSLCTQCGSDIKKKQDILEWNMSSYVFPSLEEEPFQKFYAALRLTSFEIWID